MDTIVNCIVAVDEQMGIGKCGTLPWPFLKKEMMYFQNMTKTPLTRGKKNMVIMGKNTWFSIPEKNRPLKERINVVLSKELTEPPKGAHFLAKTIDDALNVFKQHENELDMIWVIGGRSVYESALTYSCHLRLFVTRIMHCFDCDVFFPSIDFKKYTLLELPGQDTTTYQEHGIKYRFEVYEKYEN
ncbi:ORF2 [macacine gammaherpesvirus 12]|uniref:Viral dihydrofolate reductase n=1 Tax=macacine gammaherpesvirus 12 TaxID=2560571 RepID=A0A0B5D3H5_9GAMA|nr:ORF2 [Macaca nemestrina rhadinovirus 2]AJE29641.1 ORF2 [Macaca nemestrina rhadinovirus 2]